MKRMGKFRRPPVAPNRGVGKEIPANEAPNIPAVPRNRRERRALEAWKRKQGRKNQE